MWFLVSVAVAGMPDIDQPLKTGARAPADAAVVIGIEDYAFIPDVPHAKRDANAFYNLLVYTRGVPAERVELVTSPNKESIERAVTRAAGLVGDSGTLWVYYAGHGAAHPASGQRMLLGIDTMADPAGFADRALTTDRLTELAGGKNALFVLDTCYAGVGRGGTELAGGTRFAVPAYATKATETSAHWTAASASQLSAALNGVQHGAFTYFAVGALRGWADGEVDGTRDGTVTLNEAHTYVARMLRTANLEQQPELTGSVGALSTSTKLEPAPSLDPLALQGNASTSAASIPAPSGNCPWTNRPLQVAAKGHRVVIEGTTYTLLDPSAGLQIESTLGACGFSESLSAWEEWRGCYHMKTVLGVPTGLLEVNPLKPQCSVTMGRREKAFAEALRMAH